MSEMLRIVLRQVLNAEHGHLDRAGGKDCRTCRQHAEAVTKLLIERQGGPLPDLAELMKVLCTTHEPYRHRGGVGCTTCARRAQHIVEELSR